MAELRGRTRIAHMFAPGIAGALDEMHSRYRWQTSQIIHGEAQRAVYRSVKDKFVSCSID
jgi:hypothetical protein